MYTLTATVKSAATLVTPGLVNFNNGSRLLGTAQLTSSGIATFKTRLPLGTQTLTASFAGTRVWAPSASSATTLTVTARRRRRPQPSAQRQSLQRAITMSPPASLAPACSGPGKMNFVDQSNANLALGSATLGSPSAPPTFTQAASYPLGNSPLAIAACDFNPAGESGWNFSGAHLYAGT